MPDHKLPKLTHKQAQELLHSPGVVAMITEVASYYCDTANEMIASVQGTTKRRHFKVTVQNDPKTKRARAYVRPVGRTGIIVDAGQGILLKSVPAVLAQYPGTNFKSSASVPVSEATPIEDTTDPDTFELIR